MVEKTGAPRGNLPVGGTSFVGRRGELATLAGRLAHFRLLTITGVGGVGKTRLALAAAARVRHRFRDGVWLAQLSALAEPELLAHTVAGAVRLTDQTARPQLEALAEHLADRRLLLVLDSCEHLVEDCAHMAETLLAAAPGLRILATSRQPLGAAGEHTLRLAPLAVSLAVSAATDRATAGLRRSAEPAAEPGAGGEPEAVTLFVERAAAAHPGFAVTEANRAQVTELCTRLEGIPLAIELAAAQLRTMTPGEILDRLDDRFALLAAGRRPGPARHQRLLTTIGWSHELCSGDERLAWARLSVFSGGFDLEAARAVCADACLPADAVRGVLARLADKSVLLDEGPPAPGRGPRYRMLDTLREYGARWLADLGQSVEMRTRLREHYLRLARRGEQAWFGPGQAGWFARMSVEHDNFRAALEMSLGEFGDAESALELAGALWFFWVGASHLAEGRHYLDRALASDGAPGAGHATCKALWVSGYIAVLQGDLPLAISTLIRCRALARVEGDERAEAYAIHRLGCAALIGDHHSRAASLFTDALARYAGLGELNSNVIMAWIEFAMTAAFTGDLDRAVTLCEQARAQCEDYGEHWAKSYAVYVLAFAAFTQGEPKRAAELARESLRGSHSFHDLIGIVLPVELLALCAATDGAAEHAAMLQGAAGRIWKTVGTPLFGSVYFGAAHIKCRELAHAVLGEHAYQAAYDRGARLELDEAVARATGDPVPRPG
jgi:predicted ATPase